MKTIALATAFAAAIAAQAHAGGPVIVQPEPVVVPPVIVPSYSTVDWTGGYVGALLGYGEIKRSDVAGNYKDSGAMGALVGGYNHDFGTWVLGGELMLAPGGNFDVGGREVKNMAAARVRAGFKFGEEGRWLGHGSLGVARVKHDLVGGGDSKTESVPMYGLGVSYLYGANTILSAEIMHAGKSGSEAPEATGLLLGAAYKF